MHYKITIGEMKRLIKAVEKKGLTDDNYIQISPREGERDMGLEPHLCIEFVEKKDCCYTCFLSKEGLMETGNVKGVKFIKIDYTSKWISERGEAIKF